MLVAALTLAAPSGMPRQGTSLSADTFAASKVQEDSCGPDTLAASKVSAERRRALSSPAPLQELSQSQLERRSALSLSEVVKSFAGVSVRDYGGIGGLKTVSVRGMGARHTAISYDGMSFSNLQSGEVDISRFLMEDLARLSLSSAGGHELFRDASSYNASAILSLKGRLPNFEDGKRLKAAASLRAGSFNTWQPYLRVDGQIVPKWSVSASAAAIYSDGDYPYNIVAGGTTPVSGTRSNDDVRSANGDLRLLGMLGNGAVVSARLLAYYSERGLPGAVILYTDNVIERLLDKSLKGELAYELRGEHLHLRLGATYDRTFQNFRSQSILTATPPDDRYLQSEYKLSAIAAYGESSPLSLSLAADLIAANMEANTPYCPDPLRFSAIGAISARYRSASLEILASLQGQLIRETVKSGEGAKPVNSLSPSISAAWKLPLGFTLRASAHQAFRVPSFNDLYYQRSGNVSLNPEKALEFNIGALWSRSGERLSLSARVDCYHNRVKDKIVAIPTLFIWKMRNAGLVIINGADLASELRWQPAAGYILDAGLSYSFISALDRSNPEAKNYGHQIPYTPRHSANANLGIDTPYVALSYSLCAVSERYSLAQNSEASRIPGYLDHSLTLSREFSFGSTRLRLAFEALNLSNYNYELIRHYPMAGRHYRINFKITY